MRKKIVLISFYDETPAEGYIPRRSVFLGKALSENDCDVTWIKSGFSHREKQNLYGNSVHWVNEHFKIVHVPGIGYRRNACFRRYVHDWVCAKQMLPILKSLGSIDALVCANQNVAASYFACQFAKKRHIPFLFDLRDPWPDTFPYVVKSKWLRPLVELAIIPDRYLLRMSLKDSSVIISVSRGVLSWGLKKIQRQQKPTKIFYLSTSKDVTLTPQQIVTFSQKYANLLARETFKCFYVSRWGVMQEPSLLIELARQMQNEAVDFIVCGDGDYGERIHREAALLPNVFLPGFLPHEEAYFLAKHCQCGITFVSNAALEGFQKTVFPFPNKFFFYFMCGLPLLNGIPGESMTIIEEHHIGLNFHKNDLQQLQKLISLLQRDDSLRRIMGKQSRLFFAKHCNPENTYAEYAQFVKGFCK